MKLSTAEKKQIIAGLTEEVIERLVKRDCLGFLSERLMDENVG